MDRRLLRGAAMKRTNAQPIITAQLLHAEQLVRAAGGTSQKGDNTVSNVLETRHETSR